MGVVIIKKKRDHLKDLLNDFQERLFDDSDEDTRDAYFRACGRFQFGGTAWDHGMFDLCEEYTNDALEFIHICFAMHGEYDKEPLSTIA